MTRRNGVVFAQRVGIVAGAALAVLALSKAIGGGVQGYADQVSARAWEMHSRPLVAELRAEENIRRHADSLIVERLRDYGRDRIYLIDVMESPPGSRERQRKIDRVRAAWGTLP